MSCRHTPNTSDWFGQLQHPRAIMSGKLSSVMRRLPTMTGTICFFLKDPLVQDPLVHLQKKSSRPFMQRTNCGTHSSRESFAKEGRWSLGIQDRFTPKILPLQHKKQTKKAGRITLSFMHTSSCLPPGSAIHLFIRHNFLSYTKHIEVR